MCRFEMRVERVCKDIVKAFPKGCMDIKQLKNKVVGLPGKRILSSERGACPVHM